MKNCSCCKQAKPLIEFGANKRSKDGLKYICRACERISKQKHYNSNSQQYKKRTADGKRQRALRFEQYKQTLSCSRCPENDPVCLDFHHLDPNEKDFEVSQATRSLTWDKLMAEIQKCIVLCANCHRKIHKYG